MVEEILRAHVGGLVTIEFADGEVVDAKLSSVDLEEHADIIYEVVTVRSPGAGVAYEPEKLYRAKIADIARVTTAAENQR